MAIRVLKLSEWSLRCLLNVQVVTGNWIIGSSGRRGGAINGRPKRTKSKTRVSRLPRELFSQ